MDFDDWRSAKGSPDPQKGYITMAKTDSESMLLEPSQPQLYEAVLVKPVPAEEDVSLRKQKLLTEYTYKYEYSAMRCDLGLSALSNTRAYSMQRCTLLHTCIAASCALLGCAVSVNGAAVTLLYNAPLACNRLE
jgi:hypothetical protein